MMHDDKHSVIHSCSALIFIVLYKEDRGGEGEPGRAIVSGGGIKTATTTIFIYF